MLIMVIQCQCIEKKIEGPRLQSARFLLYSLPESHAQTLGTALRRALIDEIQTTFISAVYANIVPHEFAFIPGVKESFQEIKQNLAEIVLQSNILHRTQTQIVCKGPCIIRAEDIDLPSNVRCIDPNQHILTIESVVSFILWIEIDRCKGSEMVDRHPNGQEYWPVHGRIQPVLQVHYSLYPYKHDRRKKMMLLELSTNRSLTPGKAIREAAGHIICLFQPIFSMHCLKEEKSQVRKHRHLPQNREKPGYKQRIHLPRKGNAVLENSSNKAYKELEDARKGTLD